MAISQQRVIDIINAGLDFKQALDRTIQLIDDEYANHAKHDDIPPFLISLYTRCSYIKLLEKPETSPIVLVTEAKHFRQNYRRNQRNAAKAERRRRAQGAMPRQPATSDPFIRVDASPMPRLDPSWAERSSIIATPEMSEQHRREHEAGLIKYQPDLARELGILPAEPARATDWTPDDPEDSFNPGAIINETGASSVRTAGSTDFTSPGQAIPDDNPDRTGSSESGSED